MATLGEKTHSEMKRTRVLYMLRSPSYLRYHRRVLEELLSRGCDIAVVFDRHANQGSNGTLPLPHEREYPLGVNVEWSITGAGKQGILRGIRNIRSYRRFLFVKNQGAFYKERWVKYLPRGLRFFLAHAPRLTEALLRTSLAGAMLKMAEFVVPAQKRVRENLLHRRPDIAVFAFRNMPANACDVEYFKAARSLDIPTVVLVSSWDSLTTKGFIPFLPNRLLVWNEHQVAEAREHHNIPASRISIVGAYQFDEWFALCTPTLSREKFCRRFGLESRNPFLFYIGSGPITGDSIEVVKELYRTFSNSHDPRLQHVAIVVRPPLDSAREFGSTESDHIAIVPETFEGLSHAESRQLFFDCVYHATAVVALHTTGIIDALAKGKPGIVVLRESQRNVQDAEHFAQLLESGSVEAVKTPEELRSAILRIIEGADICKQAREGFLAAYLRPHGLSEPVAPRVAREIMLLARGG